MLTTKQIELFKRDGVLKLEGFFDLAEVELWRSQIFDLFHHPEGAAAWRNAIVAYKSSDLRLSNGPSPSTHPSMREVYSELNASTRWIGKNELRVRAPDVDVQWLGARAPHLDFPMVGSTRTLANSMIYLSEVEDRGGAFMYWPGSHRVAWDYFTRNPQDYRSQGERSGAEIFEALHEQMVGEAEQFLGNPGDLLIWHALTMHSGSVNLKPVPRLALIGRWGSPLDGDSYFDFEGDMWARWNISPNNSKTCI
jgi:hypothetical protein